MKSMCSKRISALHAILLFAAISALSACGPKVASNEALKKGTPRAVAVLPSNYPSGVQRERVDYLRRSLLLELKESGFTVLDDAAVSKICSSPACPEKTELASKYLVDGFFTFTLESVARNNFLAGYYNSIVGTLSLQNRDGVELIRVDNRESERGGLLFNSGQIIQGVLSQIRNSDSDSFGRLADTFTRTLVEKIPSPKKTAFEDEGAAVSINEIRLRRQKGSADEICVRATPEAMAYLLLPRERSNLRETTPGLYCARLRLEDLSSLKSEIFVEVRSPYGNSARKPLQSIAMTCDLKGLVKVEESNTGKRLVISCTEVKPGTGSAGEKCPTVQMCADHRFLVYRAPAPLGPFKRVAELRGVTWPLPPDPRSEQSSYQVVAVDEHGDFSVPEPAQAPSSGKG